MAVHMLLPIFGAVAASHFMGVRPHYDRSSKPMPGSPQDSGAKPWLNFAPFNAKSAKAPQNTPALNPSAVQFKPVTSNHISTLKPLPSAASTANHVPWNIGAHNANQHAVDRLLFGPSVSRLG